MFWGEPCVRCVLTRVPVATYRPDRCQNTTAFCPTIQPGRRYPVGATRSRANHESHAGQAVHAQEDLSVKVVCNKLTVHADRQDLSCVRKDHVDTDHMCS